MERGPGRGVCLDGVSMRSATITGARLARARCVGIDLTGTRLMGCDLSQADLRGAILHVTSLVYVDLDGADISESRVFGVGAWHLRSAATLQKDLVLSVALNRTSPPWSCRIEQPAGVFMR